jgi:hypothetical protein
MCHFTLELQEKGEKPVKNVCNKSWQIVTSSRKVLSIVPKEIYLRQFHILAKMKTFIVAFFYYIRKRQHDRFCLFFLHTVLSFIFRLMIKTFPFRFIVACSTRFLTYFMF